MSDAIKTTETLIQGLVEAGMTAQADRMKGLARRVEELERLVLDKDVPSGKYAYVADKRRRKIEAKLAPLAGLGQRIATQDNRMTDQPMFVVFQKREIVADEKYDHDRIVWVDDEGNEADDATAAQLDAMRKDPESLGWMEDEIELGDKDRREWRRLAVKEIDEFVTACFTEQGCKDFLAIQGHNMRRPYIYGAGSFRNLEYQQLRNLMLELAKDGRS